MSVCMCVRVGSSIWVNVLQYGIAAMTIMLRNVQLNDRSNDSVIASAIARIKDLQYRPLGNPHIFLCVY